MAAENETDVVVYLFRNFVNSIFSSEKSFVYNVMDFFKLDRIWLVSWLFTYKRFASSDLIL